MKISRWPILIAGLVSWIAIIRAAEPAPFSQTLTPEQKKQLGLAGLTPAQLAGLDAAIGAYTRGETTVAVQQAEKKSEEKIQQAEKKAAVAAETAVAEYKKK